MTNPGVTDLLAYWRMDEMSGNRVDSHASYDLTAYNNPLYAIGRRGKGVNFVAGSSQSLGIADAPGISMGGDVSFCIGFWFKAYNITANIRLMGKWDEGGTKEYMISVYGSRVKFFVRDAAGTTSFSSSADNFGDLSNNVWYFVHAIYNKDTNNMAVGVNDIFNTDSGPATGVHDNTNTLYFGKDPTNGYYLDGMIDEVFVYKGSLLTAAERTWMYNSGYGRTYSEVAELSPPSVTVDKTPPILIAVLDPSLNVINLIEDYYSLSWAERYAQVGDFELDLPIEYALDSSITFGNFLYIKSSNTLMIIEDIKPFSGEEETSLVVQGQSAESLLNRRILLEPINVSGPAEITIYSFIENHITAPADSDRAISLFKTIFPEMLTTVLYDQQIEQQTVYEAIKIICEATGLGFRITLYNGELVFYVYDGVDRSTSQSTNPYVIFSDDFDNVIESSFYESEKDKINIVLVITEDRVPSLQQVFVWETSEPTGIDRYETFLETQIERVLGEAEGTASEGNELTEPTLGIVGKNTLAAIGITTTPVIELSTYIPPLTDLEVLGIITTRGKQVIEENKSVGLFEGDFDIQGNFKYGVDFFMGDIVQCNLEGRNVKARIVELVRSYSTKGEKSYVAMDFII
jgi:hypothetical protein